MSAPLYDRLIGYREKNRISFAMPGHKNGRGLRGGLLDCDVTELDATEDLRRPREFISEARRLLSRLYSSDESYILTDGSTEAIQAMIAASVKRGGTLLSAADCHMSVINACALLGVKIKFIPREIDETFLITKRLHTIEKYIDGADAVIVTSPTYYGLCSDMENIAEECHRLGVPLLVDEAHGAHFAAHGRFPKSAAEFGADAVCQSAHKTLNALTGAAYLHVNGDRINRKRLERALMMFGTSSPSYVIAASADIAREELEKGGWDTVISECDNLKRLLESETRITALKNDDPTRLVFNFGEYEATGFDVSKRLSEEFGIDAEMADFMNIVLIATPWNTAEDFVKLRFALREITSGLSAQKERVKLPPPPSFRGVLSPSEAFYADAETVPLDECENRVSAVTVTPYPPGIPVIYAGARISAKQVEYIKRMRDAGAEVTGAENGMIEVTDGRETYE